MENEVKYTEGFVVIADNYPEEKVRVVVKHSELHNILTIETGGVAHDLIDACRDQWGTWYHLNPVQITIAQEDFTRSFLDALIKGLTHLKEQYEATNSSEVQ